MDRPRVALAWYPHPREIPIRGDWPPAILVGDWLNRHGIDDRGQPIVFRRDVADCVLYDVGVNVRDYPEVLQEFGITRRLHMPKRSTRTRPARRGPSIETQRARDEARTLKAAVAHQRRIRALTRQLVQATAAADHALASLLPWLHEREAALDIALETREPAAV